LPQPVQLTIPGWATSAMISLPRMKLIGLSPPFQPQTQHSMSAMIGARRSPRGPNQTKTLVLSGSHSSTSKIAGCTMDQLPITMSEWTIQHGRMVPKITSILRLRGLPVRRFTTRSQSKQPLTMTLATNVIQMQRVPLLPLSQLGSTKVQMPATPRASIWPKLRK